MAPWVLDGAWSRLLVTPVGGCSSGSPERAGLLIGGSSSFPSKKSKALRHQKSLISRTLVGNPTSSAALATLSASSIRGVYDPENLCDFSVCASPSIVVGRPLPFGLFISPHLFGVVLRLHGRAPATCVSDRAALASLTMNDREGRRLDSLSWKREALDANIRQQGGRSSEGPAYSASSSNWGSFGFRGGATRAGDRGSAASGSNGIGSSGYGASMPDVRAGFAAFRMGTAPKNTGWTAATTSPKSTQQQRKGHSAAPLGPSAAGRLHAGSAPPTAAPVSGEGERSSPNAAGAASTSNSNDVSSKPAQQQLRGPAEASFPSRPFVSSPINRNSEGAAQTAVEKGGVIDLGGGLTWKPRRGYTRQEELSRNVKSLLNKLTIEKFSVISEKIATVLEGSLKNNSEVQLIVNAVVDKAVSEPDWSEMYADLCQVLQWRSVSPEGDPDTIRKTPFMLALLNSIQTEFEAMPTVLRQELSGEGEEGQLEEARVKRRVLGVVKLIGELVQRRLLGFKVVNDVVVELVMKSEEPDEHLVECFLQLIATVGYFIDQNPKMRIVLDSWFGRLRELQSKSCYSNRLKFVIQDTIDMRRAEWRKKIHKERAKALNDLHQQLETEEVLGGAVHAAQYGNIIVVGERTNLIGKEMC
ncbi:hypothetical protein Efla_004201 [Eimeria flavescens]